MFRSLRTQLSAIFLGFLLLVGGSVTATFLTIRAQFHDATVINLAGRQRMLTQKIALLALAQPDNPDLTTSISLFDSTLRALRNGGTTVDFRGRQVTLPPAPDPALRTQLDEVARTWTALHSHLEELAAQQPDGGARSEAAGALLAESGLILDQLDGVVSAFEVQAQAKVFRLQVIQTAFFVAALLLLAWGYLVSRRRITQPLTALAVAARRVGEGDLVSPVPVPRDDELGDLGRTFETMRAEVAAWRALLETRVEQRTRELTAAFEFSQEIVAQLDLDHLLRSVTDRTRELMQAHTASLCLLRQDGKYLDLAANSGGITDSIGRCHPVQHEPADQVVGAGRTLAIEATCATCGFLRAHAPGQCIAAPLRVGEQTLGALCVVRREGSPFDPDERRALTLLANSAAIAIANARLAEAERRQTEQAAVLAERDRLAAELHDHLAQTLSFLSLNTDRVEGLLVSGQSASALNELKLTRSAIETAYGQVRAALVDLRQPPPRIDDLAAKLAACVDEFRTTSGLTAELIVADSAVLALPRLLQVQALHIVREALNNARRHARARQVQVRVERVNGEARFIVKDDGCGFNPNAVHGDNHLGLVIMRARAQRSGGRLTIDSIPGAGTTVIAGFPMTNSNSQVVPLQIR